jgi:hypothetical protein
MMEEGTVVYSDDTKPQNCHKLGGAKCRDQAGVVSDRGEPIAIGVCPLYPRKAQLGMSALGQKRTSGRLFDHLAGLRE